MSRSMLGTLFYPRTSVEFRARAEMKWKTLAHDPSTSRVGLVIWIKNEGTATAKDVTALVEFDNADDLPFGLEVITPKDWAIRPEGVGFDCTSGRAMHPEREMIAMEARGDRPMIPRSGYGMVPPQHPVAVRITVYCEDRTPQRLRIPLKINDFLRSRVCECESEPME